MRFFTFYILGVAPLIHACQRDWDGLHRRISKHAGHSHAKRQEVEYPPVLTEVESILVNSLDSRSLDSWSYYYTHGDHLGGHNRSMAEWTMDQWSAAGFDARIEEYDSVGYVDLC
jgi:N-acetylated-alpha-linked acidic dipeptidase